MRMKLHLEQLELYGVIKSAAGSEALRWPGVTHQHLSETRLEVSGGQTSESSASWWTSGSEV